MSTLQELLNFGLVEIGSDDSRFEKMQSASLALTTKFKEEPELLIPATLISLDEGVDEDDPMFSLVEDLVIAEWKTLRNTHVNRPRELLRSIIIDALSNVTDGNPLIAGTVWNTAVSPLRQQQVHLGKAGTVIEKLFKGAEQIAEGEAVIRAGIIMPASKRTRKKKKSTDNASLSINGAIKDEDVLSEVARAAGPQYPGIEELEDPNPNWSNQAQPWSNEFTPRMAAALVKAVNLGTGRLAKSIGVNLSDYLLKELSEAKKIQNEISQTNSSNRMRLDVLWWSESLYSPSLQVGYRDLPLPVAAVAAAKDLADIVPALAPASVCYVLGETLFRLARVIKSDGDQPIVSYLKTLSEKEPDFGDEFLRSPNHNVRLPLIDLVGEASAGNEVTSDMLLSRAGVNGALKLSSAEFAMWVFRDLQARRLVLELQ